ncbi:hypothetical protein ACFSBG_04055 [Georgenia yuyongxinii]|uniref:hypothetical protein n=1 Tax=Georgenia yuyongxinii TaxID=2589797 RepID=UPI00143CC705|nr:hypothetical protein [Georgenia yuyongxinii]
MLIWRRDDVLCPDAQNDERSGSQGPGPLVRYLGGLLLVDRPIVGCAGAEISIIGRS